MTSQIDKELGAGTGCVLLFLIAGGFFAPPVWAVAVIFVLCIARA